jgi:GTPase
MKKLQLALVGRPNVGKSALFNRLCNARISIVDDAKGTTRDRLYGDGDFFGQKIGIIDTGGIENDKDLPFQEEIQKQVSIALEEADTIVMVVDGRVGITPADEELARLLHRQKKPVCVAVNKIDDLSKIENVYEFYKLGIENILPVSATQGNHIAELLEMAFSNPPIENNIEELQENTIRIAIIGRTNVGKSTLLNTLLSDERSIVSPIAGTTRDSIDGEITINGQKFRLIDTAGIRRKKAEHEAVDKFAAIRTQKAIEKADICLLLLDAQEGITTQDKKIAHMIESLGKGCLLIFNKWDMMKGVQTEHCVQLLREETSFLAHCPTLFISALSKKNIHQIIPQIIEVHKHQNQRISTGQLNKFIEQALQTYHPPMIRGKRLRIFYMTHVKTQPPTFILFVNYPNLMLETYKKYLTNKFRETYRFTGNPIVFFMKKRKRENKKEHLFHHTAVQEKTP